MKTASVTLQNLLISGVKFYMADLFTFTLRSGITLKYTSHDRPITVGNRVFLSKPIQKGEISESVGLSVDTLDIELFFDSGDTISTGVTILQALRNGDFDACITTVERVFSPIAWSYNMSSISEDYVLLRFVGRTDIDEIRVNSATLKVKSMTELLNTKVPKNLYSPSCRNVLYDSACTLVRSNFTVIGEITSASTKTTINTGLSQADDYFNQGSITFTSGNNSGSIRAIKAHKTKVLTVSLPLIKSPSIGDDFIVVPGCDKTKTTCETKFNNLAHYRGFPYIPVPETLI